MSCEEVTDTLFLSTATGIMDNPLAGKLSLKHYDHAMQLINKNFFCTQCNSPIEGKSSFFQSHYILAATVIRSTHLFLKPNMYS